MIKRETKADQLIARLRLQPHPEGGHYREMHRSAHRVVTADGRGDRSAVTTIYYFLKGGEHSRFHRVRSDEIWHHYEGGPFELVLISPDLARVEHHRLGPLGDGYERTRPVQVVPADWWQAARPLIGDVLAGCTVGPGFEFDDFDMLHRHHELSQQVANRHRSVKSLI